MSRFWHSAAGWRSGNGAREWAWALPPVLGALLVMSQGLSTSRIFFDRDLSFFYWPEHLWLRSTILSGDWPLWDPHVAFGQSAIVDPVRQILFLPTLPLRLLLPPQLGFNLSVLLPIVLAGLGAFCFLRHHLSPGGASLGATVFVLAGPVLSTANSLNLSWSLAFMPWILHVADGLARSPSTRGVVLWSLLEGLQILAGEPVTAAMTALVAIAYIAFTGKETSVAKRLGLAVVSVVLGVFLVAVQVLPLLEATSSSARGQQGLGELLALHPLALAEVAAWPLYGDRFPPAGQSSPWLPALNGGHLPLFASMYVGPGALALAAVGLWLGRRNGWCRFWAALGLVATLLALGRYTPLYPALQSLVPPLASLRYPAKYFLPTVLAIAALAGFGWERIAVQAQASVARAMPAAALALLGGMGVLLVHGFPDVMLRLAGETASLLSLASPENAAPVLVAGAGTAALRLLVLGVVVSVLMGIARWRLQPLLLFAVCLADPLLVNVAVNPTLNAQLLQEPPWISATREHAGDRVYVGGRISWVTGLRDIDNVPRQPDVRHSQVSEEALLAAYQTMFASFPSAWGLREGVSLDLTALWPYDYTRFLLGFAGATREERTRFLLRTGTRYFLTNGPPSERARALVRLAGFPPVALYEEPEPLPRVAVVPEAQVEPEFDKQFVRVFSEEFDPAERVLLYLDPPSPAGATGSPQPAGAVILSETPNQMEIQTHVEAGGGYLVVWDSFDSGWVAWVDGMEAPLLRANGFFRALRLAPGDHRVRLAYRPRSLLVGATLSFLIALAMVVAFLVSWLGSRRADARRGEPLRA